MTARDRVAAGIATALLAGTWTRPQMTRRVSRTLGLTQAPDWVSDLSRTVAGSYRDKPADRPRELAAYLQTTPAWHRAWQQPGSRPHLIRLEPEHTRMGQRRWPVAELHDFTDLARLLNVDQGELAWFADVRGWERTAVEPLRHYRWQVLPRPHGGVRVVAAPKPRLKEIQRRLLRHVLARIPVHEAAHGSVTGRSVRTALAPHSRATVVLRMDLEAFVCDVAAGRIWGVLRTAGYPETVAHVITGLTTAVVPRRVWHSVVPPEYRASHHHLGRLLAAPHLPQGAPTSPALANLVAFSPDRRLSGLAARFGARYTRYVDDLTFSGGPSLRNARGRFIDAVGGIVRAEGFGVNERKTVVLGSSGRQHALGAVVNDHPTLPRPERDALRALLHNCATRGWASQAGGRSREEFRDHVLGRVSWAGGLDPQFGARLQRLTDAIEWSQMS